MSEAELQPLHGSYAKSDVPKTLHLRLKLNFFIAHLQVHVQHGRLGLTQPDGALECRIAQPETIPRLGSIVRPHCCCAPEQHGCLSQSPRATHFPPRLLEDTPSYPPLLHPPSSRDLSSTKMRMMTTTMPDAKHGIVRGKSGCST